MQVDRMRQQQDQLQKRLKDESDKKGRLEVSQPLALFHCAQLCYSVANCKSNKAVSVGQ